MKSENVNINELEGNLDAKKDEVLDSNKCDENKIELECNCFNTVFGEYVSMNFKINDKAMNYSIPTVRLYEMIKEWTLNNVIKLDDLLHNP